MAAVAGICFVMQMLLRVGAMQHQGLYVTFANLKNLCHVVVDPNKSAAVITHRVILVMPGVYCTRAMPANCPLRLQSTLRSKCKSGLAHAL
jgi:hypothetical protein